MTQKARKKLNALCRETERYSPTVQQKLSPTKSSKESAVAQSAAKYYPALKKLAEK
jgi:hypothetical protein